MSVTTTPRHRLASIARVIADASSPGCSDVLVHVMADPDDVVLGLYTLDAAQHPCDELRGAVAPPDCWAVGIVVAGRARFLDRPDLPAEPILSTYFVERGGMEVSLLRRGDVVTELQERAVGRIPDLCRGMLGLP